MRYLMKYQSDHSVLLFLFVAYLFSCAEGVKLTVSSSPETPTINDRCTIEGRASERRGVLRFMVYDAKGIDTVQSYSWNMTDHVSYDKEGWRKKNEVEIKTSMASRTFKITFTVKPSDRRKYQFLLMEPFKMKSIQLNVLRAPEVLRLDVMNLNKTKRAEILPNDLLKLTCLLQLGKPDGKFKFSAPGEAEGDMVQGKEILDSYGYANQTLELRRRVGIKDNGQPVRCSVSNTIGVANKVVYMNVSYAVQNVLLSVTPNMNVTAGEAISCTAEGNPLPVVTITVRSTGGARQAWVRRGATGVALAKLQIPETANLTTYDITCTATNTVVGKSKTLKQSALIRVVGPTMANIGLYAGIVAAVVLLMIIFAVIVFVRRHSSGESKPERTADQVKASGRYDIEIPEKQGGGSQSHGPRFDPLLRSSDDTTCGRNGGGQQDAGERLKFDEEESEREEAEAESIGAKLHYATLDLEDTPRSRMPIVFADDRNEKVEYSEIMPAMRSISPMFDDDHLYENVRHHDV